MKRIKFYVIGFIWVFLMVYAFMYYSVSNVLYEFLKLQSNSVPIKDESLSKKDN